MPARVKLPVWGPGGLGEGERIMCSYYRQGGDCQHGLTVEQGTSGGVCGCRVQGMVMLTSCQGRSVPAFNP